MVAVTIEQMRGIDRLMVEEAGVSVLMMMENAARNTAVLSKKILGGSVKGKKITVLGGKGNNCGDGLGASRHLINFGADVTVILATNPRELGEHALTQFNILKKTSAQIISWDNANKKKIKDILNNSDLLIDALLGFSLKGNPREPIAEIIRNANESGVPILAVDIPSGLEGNSGKAYEPTIKAQTTLTLALPKIGMMKEIAREYVGDLYAGDIGVPKKVYDMLGIDVPVIFEHEEIVRVR